MNTNGYLKYSILTGGGINKKGEPVKSEESWSDPIPCQIVTNTHNHNGKYEDGKFTVASYTVLLKKGACELTITKVSLSRHGVELGVFQVQNIEEFPKVGRIKIIV